MPPCERLTKVKHLGDDMSSVDPVTAALVSHTYYLEIMVERLSELDMSFEALAAYAREVITIIMPEECRRSIDFMVEFTDRLLSNKGVIHDLLDDIDFLTQMRVREVYDHFLDQCIAQYDYQRGLVK